MCITLMAWEICKCWNRVSYWCEQVLLLCSALQDAACLHLSEYIHQTWELLLRVVTHCKTSVLNYTEHEHDAFTQFHWFLMICLPIKKDSNSKLHFHYSWGCLVAQEISLITCCILQIFHLYLQYQFEYVMCR